MWRSGLAPTTQDRWRQAPKRVGQHNLIYEPSGQCRPPLDTVIHGIVPDSARTRPNDRFQYPCRYVFIAEYIASSA